MNRIEYPLLNDSIENNQNTKTVQYPQRASCQTSPVRKTNRYNKSNSPLPFICSLGLPIFQISLIVLTLTSILREETENWKDLGILVVTVLGLFSVGFAGDIIGTTIAAIPISKYRDWKFLFPLILNLLLLIPKILILFSLF